MFNHQHPYAPFVPGETEKLIVGTIPPPRFSTGKLFPEDVDFCYGSRYGLLWPILERILDARLDYENTASAIEQREQLLIRNRIGICDMVQSCRRDRMEASDQGMKDIVLRDLVELLSKHPSIKKVLFMGGNSKNGPEYLFRKHIKQFDLQLTNLSDQRPRIQQLQLGDRKILCVSLISPSSAANRYIGGDPLYKKMKAADPDYSTLDFRVAQFRKFF